MGLSRALLTPMGDGPPLVRFGAKLSNPRPNAPQEKNSASKYSKFNGNSRRSTSDFGKVSYAVVEWLRRRRMVINAVVEAAEKDNAMIFRL